MASGFLLTEQDMTEFRTEYGELIRKQCVSLMGKTEAAKDLEERVYQSVREKYADQPLPEYCETMLTARCCILSSRMESPATEEEPGTGTAAPTAPVPAGRGESGAETMKPATPAVPAAVKQAEPRETEKLPEEFRNIRVTAAYDPAKTAVWLPDGVKPDREHLQTDPEDPDELDEERSVPHSILNTFLVLSFLGSVAFFMWKTGILRMLKRTMEGIFIYG